MKIKNPILSGFYPDPSICRVEDDFYLVTSTFAYFPGVPIFRSKDLANWKQIGNVLDHESQLPLKNSGHSEGIYAPTIRYNDGIFYMITTNVSGGGNFIVTATNPEGPWSEPYCLGSEAQGIDPSLFFDTNGTCYYVGTRPNPEGVRYNGDWEIWVQEIDLESMKLVGESHFIWKGALRDVIWPEAPHLYKKDDYYYLMIAEGGTGPNHAVTIARCKEIFGSYENNPDNPILTHRHLGKDYPIVYVGHGDLVDDMDGNWYMVMLASRRSEGYIGLGRETFLAKVVWENGWPVVNPGIGKLEDVVELPFEGSDPAQCKIQTISGINSEAYDVLTLRNPQKDFYKSENGKIQLKFLSANLKDLDSPAYLGFRQLEYDYEAELHMSLEGLMDDEEAGLAILQSNEYHMLFRLKAHKNHNSEDVIMLQVIKCIDSEDIILAEEIFDIDNVAEKIRIKMMIRASGQKADFIIIENLTEVNMITDVDIYEMSTEIAGGFVGNTIGVYASSCGKTSKNSVQVNDFTIKY